MLQKYWLYYSACYIHKRVYYCHGITRRNSATRNCFLEHQHCMDILKFDWCVCLTSLHSFTWWIKILNLFSSCCLVPTLLHSSSLSCLKILRYPLVLASLIAIMTALVCSFAVMTQFMPETVLKKGAWFHAKKTSLSCLKMISNREIFIYIFGHRLVCWLEYTL